jgi:methylated-DNA-protein-cysteine methyltransferase related protein
MLSEFAATVIKTIKAIPSGKVATYSQIAELSGKPHAARGVSWILHSCSTRYKLPWHRVLNAQGKISFEKNSFNYRRQKKRLENEGIVFRGEILSLPKYQWKKKSLRKRASRNKPKMFS